MKTWNMTGAIKAVLLVACVFAPFVVIGYALLAIPDKTVLHNLAGQDWIWLILLAAMMLGLYYFLAIYVREKHEATAQFKRLDRDRDGFISLQDAGDWPDLRRLFDKFDADHDGRMSRIDFEAFQRSRYSH
jgi:hypothetical protein